MRSKQKLIIWHLNSNRWHSAITEYAFCSFRSLEMRGHSNRLFLKRGSAAADAAKKNSLDFEELDSFSAGFIRKYFSESRENRPDAIFCYGGQEASAAGLLRSKCCVIRFRGEYPRGLSAKFPNLHGQFGFLNRTTIYPSQFLISRVAAGRNSEKNVSIPLGRDEKKFFFDGAESLQQQRPILLILGRLDPIKGHEHFAEIFAQTLKSMQIKHHGIKPHLKIIGEAQNLTEIDIQNTFNKIGLRIDLDYSITCKRVENISEEISRTTLGIIPSLGSELIARVAEEFLMCGVPIFVSGAGSLAEIAKNGDGWSYLEKSLDEKASLLMDAIISSSLESSAARMIRSTDARAEFSLETMGNRLNQLLQKIVN